MTKIFLFLDFWLIYCFGDDYLYITSHFDNLFQAGKESSYE